MRSSAFLEGRGDEFFPAFFAMSDDFIFLYFDVGQLALCERKRPCGHRLNWSIRCSAGSGESPGRSDRLFLLPREQRFAVSMTGFAPDFNGLILFGIEVAIAHDIKLGMAVNTIKTLFKVNILKDLVPVTGSPN